MPTDPDPVETESPRAPTRRRRLPHRRPDTEPFHLGRAFARAFGILRQRGVSVTLMTVALHGAVLAYVVIREGLTVLLGFGGDATIAALSPDSYFSFLIAMIIIFGVSFELPLLLTKLSSAQRRKSVEIALQVVGLADRAKHKPRELSGGQEQRVAIARAIVSDPNLLVCDEPTGDLDRATADEILKLLQALNRDHGKTIVMVTHDPLAAEYANRTLHLDKGRLAEQAVGA